MQSVNKHPSSVIVVVKIDNASATDAKTAMNCLRSDHNISKLDTVIVKAAVQNLIFAKLADVDPAQVQEHLPINAVGSLVLFQAVLPLLQKGSQPKFVVMGSAMGSVSKAALHYLIRKIHFENEGLIAFAVDPG